jgi:xylulokinase
MYLLGYDIGSSSVKAALVDAQTGVCVASAFYPPQEAPIRAERPGFAEQDPNAWWDYLRHATSAVLASSRIAPTDIAAIGISYQMHGLVLIDRDRRLLRDAIIWCDSRGVAYGRRALADLGDERCLSHLLNAPGNFTATKLAWVKEHEPELFGRIYKVLLPGDYIAMRLTGEIRTTVEGLSEMMLWDFSTHTIARFLLDYFGFDASIFPDTVDTFAEQGRLTAQAARELGLAEGTPVTYRAGDQPNNALSLNVFNPGEIASTAGTSGVVYGINDSLSYDPKSRINNFAHVNHTAQAPRIGVMTCISGTGILNSWMKRNAAPDGISYAAMNDLAATAPVGSAGVSILPFGNGAERILGNNDTGCSIHGINFNIHRREHLLRAAQEGIVFALMYGIEVMSGIGMQIATIHAGEANMFLSPIFRETLAAVSGAVIKLFDTDGAAGAARGAGLGAGIYRTPQEAFATLHCLQSVTPPADRTPYLEAYARWKSLAL